MAQIRQIIEFSPEGSTWADWNGNFLHYFGEEPIPYYVDEKMWKEVAQSITQLATFNNYALPDPDEFENWQDWANELITVVNGPTI